MQGPWPFVLLLAAAAAVILVQSWRLHRSRSVGMAHQAAASREEDRKAAAHARGLRAADGEASAFALLERAGYAVLGRQVPGSWTVRADGEALTFGLRADYLVARGGRRYIAEVKTGRLAPRLSHGPTRRQLLEYSAAFDVHGVLLVDADGETITHVEVDVFGDRDSQRDDEAPSALGVFVRTAAWTVVGVVLLSLAFFAGSEVRAGR